ncbi:hypothetical protein ACVW0Y_000138 [Pseudomonas sp. TE3786]
MAGETSLAVLLRTMRPHLNSGDYVFCCIADPALLQGVPVLGSFQEQEGLSVILSREQADKLGLAYDYVAAWITLTVHSDLAAVGLTAAFATALGNAGLSCNVIAGYHHDHLFVASTDAARAMAVLQQLTEQAE